MLTFCGSLFSRSFQGSQFPSLFLFLYMRDSDQSSTSSRSTSSLLSDLHQALAALNLAPACVSRLSATLTRRDPPAASASRPSSSLPLVVAVPVPAPPTRVPLLRGGSICRGDFVTVNNQAFMTELYKRRIESLYPCFS